MTPRKSCPVCKRMVPVNRDGRLRAHRVYRSQLEQDPTTHLGRTRVCEGSGTRVR
jgi:hypothetical protein